MWLCHLAFLRYDLDHMARGGSREPAGRLACRPRPTRLRYIVLAAVLLLASGVVAAGLSGSTATLAAAPAACEVDPATPKRQFRAMWIASVANLDWPSRTGLSVAAQQAEFRAWLDLAEAHHFNAVIVQVRPTADAFWPSPYEPWSHWLTGTQGAHPGYDPLAFLVQEAHARNLELHAWFNPYRVATHTDRSRLARQSPGAAEPGLGICLQWTTLLQPGYPGGPAARPQRHHARGHQLRHRRRPLRRLLLPVPGLRGADPGRGHLRAVRRRIQQHRRLAPSQRQPADPGAAARASTRPSPG